MNVSEQEIIGFIEKEFWKSKLNSNSDIFNELKISGDDCDELLVKYSKKYQVDMSDFLWYFHHEEEGSSIFGFLFKPPNKRVPRIPVTPKMLAEFANSKKWNIDYPEHKLPKYRFDMFINWLFILLIILFIFYKKQKL